MLGGNVADVYLKKVLESARGNGPLSDKHFTVDGTLIEAWAGQKSLKKKEESGSSDRTDDPGNPTVDFHGETNTNQTHESSTEPESRLYRKGPEKKLNSRLWDR